MNTRPLTLLVAIVLLILLSVFGLITPFAPNPPPLVIQLYGFIVMGVGGLLAVVGSWLRKRWGLWLTIGISALSILLNVAGLVVAPNTVGKVISAVLLVAYALVLVLVTRPAARQAFASARARAAA
jgi:hypothetical protein